MPLNPEQKTISEPRAEQTRPPRTYRRFGLLQLIGVFKVLKGIGSLIAAGAALHLVRNDDDEVILEWARRIHVAPGNRILGDLLAHVLEKLLAVTHRQWQIIAAVLGAYAVMFLVEGIGLLLNKHWAEWMAVITTCGLIPLEIYEVFFHFGWGKAITLVINIIVAIYLIVRVKREARQHRQNGPPSAVINPN